ncbi:MAG TPA: carbohydate-binding domain-containing protein, partial [Flavisolibacter sp.]
MKFFLLVTLVLGFMISNAQQNGNASYQVSNLDVRWEIVENNHKGKTEFLSAFTLANRGGNFPAKGWRLYFNFPRMIQSASVTGGMKIDHINGDFYQLSPTENFKGLPAKQSVRVEFVAGAWGISISDAPAGLYVVWDAAPEKGIALTNYTVKPSTEPKQYLRTATDKMGFVTPQKVYEQNKNITDIPANELIKVFPTPVSYKETGNSFVLENNFSIKTANKDNLEKEADYLEKELKALFSNAGRGGKEIILTKNGSSSDAYTLTVTPQNIVITSGTNRGIFYGIQSLKTLLPAQAYKGGQTSVTIPTVEVRDSAR